MVPQADVTWEYRLYKSALSTIKEGKVMTGTMTVEDDLDNHDLIDDF